MKTQLVVTLLVLLLIQEFTSQFQENVPQLFFSIQKYQS